MSDSVARRTPEIGLRRALGAERRDVIGLVLRESAAAVAVGALVAAATTPAAVLDVSQQYTYDVLVT